jgi:hypothetical protein
MAGPVARIVRRDTTWPPGMLVCRRSSQSSEAGLRGCKMNPSVTFSDEVFAKVGDEGTRSLMRRCQQATAETWSALDSLTENLVFPPPPDDILVVHKNHVTAILASTAARYVSLTISLIEAVNRFDFLTYALVARSIVEIVATLRHLLVEKLDPITQNMTGPITSEEVKKLLAEEDIYLRGTRFDWNEFLENDFLPLKERYAEWLEEKKKDKTAKKWKPGRTPPKEQVNVATCLEKWARVEPGIGVLYDLLCDMVHPNIGSVMSIMITDKEQIRFKVRHPSSGGFRLFLSSFPVFMKLTGEERAGLMERLLGLILLTDPDLRIPIRAGGAGSSKKLAD